MKLTNNQNVSLCSTALNLRFAQILNDGAMFNANAVGTAVSVVYISIYYRFVLPEDKMSHLTKLLGTIALIVAFIVYSKVCKVYFFLI